MASQHFKRGADGTVRGVEANQDQASKVLPFNRPAPLAGGSGHVGEIGLVLSEKGATFSDNDHMKNDVQAHELRAGAFAGLISPFPSCSAYFRKTRGERTVCAGPTGARMKRMLQSFSNTSHAPASCQGRSAHDKVN